MKKNITSNLKAIFKTKGELILTYHISRQHLNSAKYFSSCAQEIESSTVLPINDEVRSKHLAFVTGSIILSVAALESSINEFYCEAIDKNPNTLKGIDSIRLAIIAEFWEEIERLSILQKYQKALFFLGIPKFEEGNKVFQDAENLVKLRDLLIHYKPEWDNELNIHAKIEKRLNGKFPLSPFASMESLWFPHQCLGFGCSNWSIATIIT